MASVDTARKSTGKVALDGPVRIIAAQMNFDEHRALLLWMLQENVQPYFNDGFVWVAQRKRQMCKFVFGPENADKVKAYLIEHGFSYQSDCET